MRDEFAARGCYFLEGEELDKVRKTIIINGSAQRQDRRPARAQDRQAGRSWTFAERYKVLIGEVESVDLSEEFAHEKLSPVLAMYQRKGL